MSDEGDFNDEWVTAVYESCSTAVASLQAKEKLSPEEEGLNNICEVVVYLYGEIYEDPMYVSDLSAASTRVLH